MPDYCVAARWENGQIADTDEEILGRMDESRIGMKKSGGSAEDREQTLFDLATVRRVKRFE
jgi:hypothetical protein